MKIIVKNEVKKMVTEIVEIDIPAFFKKTFGGVTAFYSPDHAISVYNLESGFVNISKDKAEKFIDAIDMNSPISEDEFNRELNNAIHLVTGLVPVQLMEAV